MKRILSFIILFTLVGCSLLKGKRPKPPEIRPITLHSIVETFNAEFPDVSVVEVSYFFKSSTYIYKICGVNETKSVCAKYMAEDGVRFSLDVTGEIFLKQEIKKEDLDTLLSLINIAGKDIENESFLDAWYLYETNNLLQLDIYFVDDDDASVLYSYDVKTQSLLNKEKIERE